MALNYPGDNITQGKRYGMKSNAAVYLHTLPNKEFQVTYSSTSGYITIQKATDCVSNTSIVTGGKETVGSSSTSSGLLKLQSYPVDSCYLNTSPNALDIETYHGLYDEIRRRSCSLALDLGVNSSIWLVGRHVSFDYGDLLFSHQTRSVGFDYFRQTLNELFMNLQNHATQTKSLFRLGFVVKVKCFEVYAEQIRDLLNSDGLAGQPTIRESKSIPYVDSLVEITCESGDHAYSVLHDAYSRRLSLLLEHHGVTMNSIPNIERRSFVGYVGNVIIQLTITQTLCSVISVESNPDLIQRSGTIQYNILADNDALTYKPVSRSENLLVVPLHAISSESGLCLRPGSTVVLNDNFVGHSRLVSQQLLSSAKAISTLSRVVTKLYRDSQNSQIAAVSHISYRDSILTRVLQASLEGKFANCICFFLDLRKTRFSSDTSMTSAQSCSNFLRMMSELHGAMKMSSFLRSSDIKVTQSQKEFSQLILVNSSNCETKNCNESNNEEVSTEIVLQHPFWSLLQSFRDELSTSAISTLVSLEEERNQLLENLGGLTYNDVISESKSMSKEVTSSEEIILQNSSAHVPSALPTLKPPNSQVNTTQKERITSQSLDTFDEVLSLITPPSSAKVIINSEIVKSRSVDSKTYSPKFKTTQPSPRSSPLQSKKSSLPSPSKDHLLVHRESKKLLSPTNPLDITPEIRKPKLQSKVSVAALIEASNNNLTLPSPPISRESSIQLFSSPSQKLTFRDVSIPTEIPSPIQVQDSTTKTSPSIAIPEIRKTRERSIILPQVKGIKDYFDSDDCPDNQSGLSDLEIQFLKAVSHSNFPVVKSCIDQGVNLGVKNSFGRDAVQISTRNGSLEILRLLYESGATLNTRGKRGDTLFHLASANGHLEIMKWLTSVGVMHNMVDITGQTCAHVAARRGEINVLKYLETAHQMDFNQKDFDDQTPLDKIPKSALNGNELELEETRVFLLSRMEKLDP